MPHYQTSVATIHLWPTFRPIKLLSTHERWRRVARIINASKEARMRLDWIIYHREGHSVRLTCRHFDMTPKTFYKWYKAFDPSNPYTIHLLADRSKAPKQSRGPEVTQLEELRVMTLRRQHMAWGKEKLQAVYATTYQASLSTWKIQRVINRYQLYLNPTKKARTVARRARARLQPKHSITELKRLPWYRRKALTIICLDTIVIYWQGTKRYIFTAIDKYSKVAFARMYTTKSSSNAEDFLYRLYYLLGRFPSVGHDNGTEFAKHFAQACTTLGITQYHSRPRTPKDNATNERFNRTLEDEFINLGNFSSDPVVFNRRLTEWLVEYNFQRPHQALNYQTPIQVTHKGKVLPMYPAYTDY